MLLIPQLLLLVLCTLGPEHMDALITTTFQYVEHVRLGSKDIIDTAFIIAFHIIFLLPLRVIVAASLYHASVFFAKKPFELTSIPSAATPTIQKEQQRRPTEKTDNSKVEEVIKVPATTPIVPAPAPAVVVDKPAAVVPEPLLATSITPVTPAVATEPAVIQPFEAEEIVSPSAVSEEEDQTSTELFQAETQELSNEQQHQQQPDVPRENPIGVVEPAVKEEKKTPSAPQAPLERTEQQRAFVKATLAPPQSDAADHLSPVQQEDQHAVVVKQKEEEAKGSDHDNLTIPAGGPSPRCNMEKHAPSRHFVQPSAETPKIGSSNSDDAPAAAEAHAAEANATATTPATDAAVASIAVDTSGDAQSELSSHHEGESSSVESKETSHTSAASSIQQQQQQLKKERSFSLRISRSASNMRNRINAARHNATEPEDDKQQQQQKSRRLFPLPSLSKRRSPAKKDKQQEQTKLQPQPSKTRKRLSALFH